MKYQKHKLAIIDAALANPGYISGQGFPLERVKSLAAKAQRFHFTQDASTYLGRFIKDCGDLLFTQRSFMKLPFDPCYIEINLEAMFQAIGEPTTVELSPNKTNRDVELGYLFAGNDLFEFFRTESGITGITPIAVTWHESANPGLLFSPTKDLDDWTRIGMLFGNSLHDIPDEETRQEILTTTRFHLYTENKIGENGHLSGTVAFARNGLAALLALNQTNHKTLTAIGAKAQLISGKRQIAAAHTLVHLDLVSKDKMRTAVLNGRRESPRRHKVRGHFAHHITDETCEHAWPTLPNSNGHWVCGRCRSRKWWCQPHLRGDAEKGSVSQSYLVTDSSAGQ